jgi:Ala-tRNA(Pro) deacylase
MAIASKVEEYLLRHGVRYDVIAHPHSCNSTQTAQLAHVRGERVAKSVVLKDHDGIVMAVLPSTSHVRLGVLSRQLNRNLRLAAESELSSLFVDCELGAIPVVGLAYGMATVVDDSLADQPEIYFEAGDHERLVHMHRDDFAVLMNRARHGRFAAPM